MTFIILEFTSRHSLEWKFLFIDHRAPPIIGMPCSAATLLTRVLSNIWPHVCNTEVILSKILKRKMWDYIFSHFEGRRRGADLPLFVIKPKIHRNPSTIKRVTALWFSMVDDFIRFNEKLLRYGDGTAATSDKPLSTAFLKNIWT